MQVLNIYALAIPEKLYTVKGEKMNAIKIYENGKRKAIITKKSEYTIVSEKYSYVVNFYYDGFPDYEWKRGAHGIACDLCETLGQAKRKAKYYISKDNEAQGV